MSDVIRVDDLTFCYNGTAVISDVSLTIQNGDYLGIAGSNGSGKSTLIKNILGILQPSKGTVFLFGQPLSTFNQWDKIGYLPQRINALNYHFPSTVGEIVQLGIKKRNAADLQKTLRLMGIEHLSAKLIGELSYGEQQRVMLARALIRKPELLIFDEPTTALDPETRDVFYSITDAMNRNGTTVVLITHDTGIIGKYARHLLYLDKKVIFSGTFEDFCCSPDMTGFFGSDSQHMICHQHDKTEMKT
ncbi:MAG TPA: metal ABC transporter ATP-binding protein [Smithella sp.]|nr:metal ABC transporter ATP-binding protein [Smithella sp.]MDM7988701.1 metal ABC transporter ATP-binding protein [Smithella sp.]HNY49354.1 metal ABC transporter ATP-binding protein [Smithella sp.]HOG89455.1 metal ABC transporter ATP-binding protein [Smithella sp.]HOU50182.1 metal ABC transporter ATP-binding protein [Smithella sp.]